MKLKNRTTQKSNKLPIYFVIGTRAQFIKVAPIMRELLDRDIDYTLIYTAQHQENIQEILDVYDLPSSDKVIYHKDEADTMSKGWFWVAHMVVEMFLKAKKHIPKKGIVLTHGDTFTAWLAAIMGRLAGCKVAHVESGLRSYNIFRPFPEELSRLVTFTFSNIYFCPNEWAVNNLKFFRGEKINIGGNTLIDGVRFALKSKTRKFDFQKEKYVVAAVHRYENIYKPVFTNFIIPKLKEISKTFKVIVTVHPTTRERLKMLNLYEEIDKHPRIILHKRFDFTDWINVCNSAEFVITDGGSNQEELSYLGIPTILFRSETERKEGLGENVVISYFKDEIVDEFVENYEDYRRPPISIEVSPTNKIVDYLEKIRQ